MPGPRRAWQRAGREPAAAVVAQPALDARSSRSCADRRETLGPSPTPRGFSLIEVLVVVALIAAVGVLAVGVLGNGFERLRLRSAVNEVAGNLRHTRALAISTGQPQRFVIVPHERSWRAAGDRHGELPGQLSVEFTGAREVQPREGEGAIVFFPDGASTGGRVALASATARWNVDVAWLTGEVRVHRGEPVR
ncbi:prepilin-type N-terminal cleavage/methylation domain-containing protein [Luteimonas yindakuii]|uniref:Type II secretion system protein H n=1 Tax=Luteimonas yindakuii TaxID=2565782 RepID=A0A4Z1RF96_9GAMM|nr:prepilin-type N-terminal cleavage/methylation domain-containing protein [Luteimonas yindakuii]